MLTCDFTLLVVNYTKYTERGRPRVWHIYDFSVMQLTARWHRVVLCWWRKAMFMSSSLAGVLSRCIRGCVLLQRYGLSELELGASLNTSMRGPLCSLNLIAYYSYAPYMFGNFSSLLFVFFVNWSLFFSRWLFSSKFRNRRNFNLRCLKVKRFSSEADWLPVIIVFKSFVYNWQ